MRKYLAFDLEIYENIPEGATNWREHMPLGISCIGTVVDERHARTGTESGPVAWRPKGSFANGVAMSELELKQFILYLQFMVKRGFTILTWNGLGFDFPVLAETSGLHTECKKLAVEHVDMMWHIFCAKGHYLGLNKAAKGQGLSGKTEGMSGDKVPTMWREGDGKDRLRVLEYVKQDVVTTLQVAQVCEAQGRLNWLSNKQRPNYFKFDKWLTIREAYKLPAPDTSWMTDPPSRTQFTTWLEEYLI